MIKFPKIGQFRQAIKELTHSFQYQGVDESGKVIMNRHVELPVVTFEGTVKLHGTNAAIVRHTDGTFSYQSRKNVLTRQNDNAGFCNAMMDLEHSKGVVSEMFSQLTGFSDNEVIIYGEWAGQGIQKGVGISELPKAFYIFAIRIYVSEFKSFWLDIRDYLDIQDADNGIYNLKHGMFPRWSVLVDLNNPSDVTQTLEEITLKVEAECPVAKALGVSGIGEGVVWKYVLEEGYEEHTLFKVKGSKHSDTKVKKLVTVDPQVMKDLKEFCENTVTDHRMEKGISSMLEEGTQATKENTGQFIRWAINDIMEEELDTIIASKLDRKKLGGMLAKFASRWYLIYLNKF